MNTDVVLELVSRRESGTLDFKRAMYDWDADGNYELAKDLMAIANNLGPDAPAGHILIGVEEVEPDRTGRIVGANSAEHLDDSKMHDKIKYLLNRMPNFSYAPVSVGNDTVVGVFEIRAGGRPIYPLNSIGSRHKLVRFQPMYRAGSATDVASPDQVIEWAQQDDAVAARLRALDLEQREMQLGLHVRLVGPGTASSADKVDYELTVVNDGEAPFRIVEARVRWSLDSDVVRQWLAEHGARLISPLPEEFIQTARTTADTVRAEKSGKVSWTVTGTELNRHFQRTLTEGSPPPPPYSSMVVGRAEVNVQGLTAERRRTVVLTDLRPWRPS
jgi:hypothetical protein